MDKKIFCILLFVITLFVCGYFLIDKSENSNLISKSDSKASLDDSNIDWSKYEVYDISLDSGNVNISKAGVYNISGSLSDGQIIVNTNDNVKLILNGVSINSNGPSIYVKNAKNVYIELKGENKIVSNTTDTLDAAIYSKSDLFMYGDGSISITSNKDGIASKDDLTILSGTYTIKSDDDSIKGRDSLTIKNGNFNIKGADGIKTTNEKKGTLVIENGTFNIESVQDGIDSVGTLTIKDGNFKIVTTGSANKSSKGIKGANIIIDGGVYSIDSVDDAIHSNGDISINGGKYEIKSSDDGVHADGNLNINLESLKINNSHEGLEAYNITINNGDINIVANDDGVNVAGGSDSSGSEFSDNGGKLTINGGKLYVNSKGDGLDSNGSIYMTGGEVYVDGPTDNGNGALDYNGEFKITGGELIAVGSSGMVQNVSNSSTQTSVLVNLTSSSSGEVSIGEISYSPSKNYQSILISSSKLKSGESYILKYGSNTLDVSLSGVVTTIGNSGGMMGGRGFGRR